MTPLPPSREADMKFGQAGKTIYIDMIREDEKSGNKFYVKEGAGVKYMNYATARKGNAVYNKMIENQKKRKEYEAKLLQWEKDRAERRRSIAAYAARINAEIARKNAKKK